MSKVSHVVDGEASESDSEIELAKSPDASACSKAFVISGEAPESDDESKIPPPNEMEIDVPLHTSMMPSSPPKMYTSLLHQKLSCPAISMFVPGESNVTLRATVEGLVKHTTDICVEKLSQSDKTLLCVQESMRSTNASLTLARARLKQLHGELEKANCATAFPSVRIK